MKIVSKHPLLVGTVFLTLASVGVYGCKDFLTRNETPRGTLDAETYLNEKWRITFEGIVRVNSAIRLLKQVQKSNPTAISAAAAKGIQGEAEFLRAHYHFEAWRMWGNIPYYREDDTDFRK